AGMVTGTRPWRCRIPRAQGIRSRPSENIRSRSLAFRAPAFFLRRTQQERSGTSRSQTRAAGSGTRGCLLVSFWESDSASRFPQHVPDTVPATAPDPLSDVREDSIPDAEPIPAAAHPLVHEDVHETVDEGAGDEVVEEVVVVQESFLEAAAPPSSETSTA